MKLSMFTNASSYKTWLLAEIKALRENGLANALKAADDILAGVGKEQFMKMNNIPEERWDEEWENHWEWQMGQANAILKKIQKYAKEVKKCDKLIAEGK